MKNNKQNPLVSVLIPLYNAEKYFDECITSVINQSYQNIEIIIVDDGSTDESLDIAKKYEKNYDNISVYSQENRGAASARNKAFSYSKGEYIQYFDADDIMHKGKIYYQIEELRKYDFNPGISTIGKWFRFNHRIENIIIQDLVTYRNYDNPLQYLITCWKTFQCMIGTAWLIHKELNEKVSGWDETLSVHDDYLFFATCAYHSQKIVFAEKSIVYWRQENLNSLSKVVSYSGLKSHLSVCDRLVELIENDITQNGVKESLAMEYSKLIYKVYPRYTELTNHALNALKKLGYSTPLPMPTKKFRLSAKLIGFYPTVRLFKLKDSLVKKIRGIKDSK